MRFAQLCRRSLLVVSLFAAGIAVQAQTTSFSGTVYSPVGAASGDPIPNILVFVEDPADPAIATFDKGISVPGGSCAQQPSLVPNSVLGSAISKYDGTFSFNVAGTLPDPVNLYIQAGKWREKITLPKAILTEGGSNAGFVLSMPKQAGTGTFLYNQQTVATQADLPYIAVVTGSVDDIECIFPQIGISPSEVTDPSSNGHINLFLGTGSGGQVVNASTTPTETQLVNPGATGAIPVTNYDLVMFGCQGTAGRTDSDGNNTTVLNNMQDYANSGGRIFATHWEIPWVNLPSQWSSLSTFAPTQATGSQSYAKRTAQLSTSYTGEPTLAAWMNYVGALDVNAAQLQFSLTKVFPANIISVQSPAQTWVTLPNDNNVPNQFSFDTPVGATGQPTASLNFSNTTNSPNVFLTGDPHDVVTVTVSNTSNTATIGTLTLTLTIPQVLNIQSVQDTSGGGFVCNPSSTNYVCTLSSPLQPGATDSVSVAFSIPSTGVQLGTYSLKGVITGGGLNQSTQCGRVLYNSYHVETSATKKSLWNGGAQCDTGSALSTAQKFLEYSLYNLSSFVAPANSDTIQIQQSSGISWTVPTPVYYGTTIAQIENGTVNTPGTSTWSFTPTGSDLLDPGTYNFTLKFQPTDSTDYLPAQQSKSVTVVQDPTVSTMDNLETSIFYGEEIGYSNGVDATVDIAIQPNLPNLLTYPLINGGAETITLDGVTVCSGTAGQPLSGPYRNGTNVCPDAGFQMKDAGPHAFHLSYAGTKDFSPSDYSATVTVNSDPTTTTLVSSATGATVLGTNIVYNASVADDYTTAIGTLTFYDSTTSVAAGSTPPSGATVIGSVATANGKGTLSLAALPVGTHNIFVCFSAPKNGAGYFNFAASCTASAPQIVNSIPVSPEGTAVTLVSSANPSPFGNNVSFTATVQSTGAFTVIPVGTLTFLDNGNPIGTSTLDGKGVATLTTNSLAIGTHPITASYSATATLATTALSATLNETIISSAIGLDTGFLLRVNPVTVPVFVGSTATATVQVITLTNFNEAVQLTCTGLPAQAACAFAQSTLPAGGGTTTLILSSGAPHDCSNGNPYFASFGGRGALALLSLSTVTLCFARRRRKLQAVALTVMLLLLPAVFAGCGTPCTDFAVKPGDYAFRITAQSTGSSNTSHSQDMVMHATLQ